MWGALLYFGASKSPVDQTNQARWQLITKLFSCSVLAKSPHEDSRLPPNPKQLAVFESDIDIFARLLRRGTLDELPATDTLVINLVKRAIALQAEDYLLNEESRFCSFPSFGDEKSAAKLVSGLWKSTHGLLMQDASTIENERETVDEVNFRRSRGKKLGLRVNDLLLPLSPLLGGCLSLLLAWARRVPKKKVRRMRLLKQLKALRESLICLEVDLMQRCSKDSGSDAFVDAFVGNRSPETGDANGRMSAFLGEAAGYLKILEYLIGERDLSITAVTPCTNNILIMAKEVSEVLGILSSSIAV